jgi:hypothetical protein
MGKRKSEEIGGFSISFVDLFANSLGGLLFILVLVIMMITTIQRPKINTLKLPDAHQDIPYEIWLSAREGGGHFKWALKEGTFPKGMEMIDTTGFLHGTPQLADPSKEREEYRFTLIVRSGANEKKNVDERSYSLWVYKSDFTRLQIVTDRELPDAINGRNYPLTLAAAGGKSPYKWELTTRRIEGLTLNLGGTFQGTVQDKPGTYSLPVRVTDGFHNSVEKNLDLKILPKQESSPLPPPSLKIKTEVLPEAVTGRKYNLALSCEGGFPPNKWSGSINNNEFILSESGRIEGLPGKKGECRVNVTVTDNKGNKDSRSWNLTVLPPQPKPEPLMIRTDATLPDAITGKRYSLQLSGSGGLPPYTWSFGQSQTSNRVVSLDRNGLLSATFPNHGTLQVPITLTDSLGDKALKTFSLDVFPAQSPLKIVTHKIPFAVKGYLYSVSLSACGGVPPYSWNIEDNQLPQGLRLMNGTISGIPSAPYHGSFMVSITDLLKNRDSLQLTLEVLESGRGSIVHSLELLTKTLPLTLIGDTISTFLATKGGGTPLRWECQGELPRGISFKEGHFTGKAKSESSSEVHVRVTDVTGQYISRAYRLEARSLVPWYWKHLTLIISIISLIIVLLFIYFWFVMRKSKKFPLRILTASIPRARISTEYSVQLAAIGGVPPYTWRLVRGKLPTGLKLSYDGIISGAPLEKGELSETREYKFIVEVKDQVRNTATKEL